MREPDPQLLSAARGGDPRAFEDLVRRYQPGVWRLALYLVHDRELAEEVAQEAFVRVFRFLPRFRGQSAFSTWLYAITRNCARDMLRAAGRDTRLNERLVVQPSRLVEDQSLRYEIKDAIRALPLDLREPLVLVDMFEVSYAEASSILKIPQGTVKSRVFRARQILIETLSAEQTREADHEA